MAPKLRRYVLDEVKSRWATMLPEHRQGFMSFEDPFLVERIKCALQALFEKQTFMSHLGLHIGESPDPFASSTLFTTAFEFTWHIGRSKSNPSTVLVDPASMPVMAMKLTFLQSVDFFQDLQCVLPDFLSSRSGRVPLPRARWKEIWAIEPSSVSGMEQSLVKLVEQALWTMMCKPVCDLAIAEAPAVDIASEPVQLEAWMVDDKDLRPKEKTSPKKKKKEKRRASVPKPLETTLEESLGLETPAEDADGSMDAGTPLHECIPEAAVSSEEDQEDMCSDADESVCMGTFHVDGEGSCMSHDPTASSTPATGFGNVRGQQAPQPSKMPTSSKLAPPELVCYIWSQTAQFGQERDPTPSSHLEPTSPVTGCTTPQVATPFSRGQWMTQPSTPSAVQTPKVVVRNTFVDIDDPDEEHRKGATRRSRSLSPSRICAGRDDPWHDARARDQW
mmetsp:Transcript_86654/g.223193  ORF Transcript_86654/g.223193 Transcript_86654/m.223193 type:complete len:447 (+) Transcript_86654:99-1439(+)